MQERPLLPVIEDWIMEGVRKALSQRDSCEKSRSEVREFSIGSAQPALVRVCPR